VGPGWVNQIVVGYASETFNDYLRLSQLNNDQMYVVLKILKSIFT